MPNQNVHVVSLRQSIETMGELNKVSVGGIMQHVRVIIEKSQIESKYKHLFMYCNWCSHSELERNEAAREILEKLTKVICDKQEPLSDSPKPGYYHQAICDVFDFKQLRTQLADLFKEHSIPSKGLFDRESYWPHFCGYLRQLISGRPIKLDPTDPTQGKKAKEAYARMKKYDIRNIGSVVTSVIIESYIDTGGQFICMYQMELERSHISIVGHLVPNE